MRLVALFEDTPTTADVRARLQAQHLDYLRRNQAESASAAGCGSPRKPSPS